MFAKHKLSDHLPSSPNNAFTVTSPFTNKTPTTTYDCRMLRCYNDKCGVSTNGDSPTRNVFHFCCYLAFFYRQNSSTNQFSHIIVDKTNVSRVFEDESIERVTVDTVLEQSGNILLPVCSKRCYNAVKHSTNIDGNVVVSKKKKTMMESNWDNDGGPNARSSEKIIVDWLCDKNNNRMWKF